MGSGLPRRERGAFVEGVTLSPPLAAAAMSIHLALVAVQLALWLSAHRMLKRATARLEAALSYGRRR